MDTKTAHPTQPAHQLVRRTIALVLAGGRGWDDTIDDVVARTCAADPRLRVLRPGYLPLDDLAGFLGGALVVCYPSLIEGFGLPVLEAMACGAAVLTTRRGPLPEVGGDAVAYTGTGPGDIATALGELLADPVWGADLGRAGVQRSAGFTWRACAERHVLAYQRAMSAAGRKATP